MQVVIKKAFDHRVEGDLIDLHESVANALIEKGHVEIPSDSKEVKELKPKKIKKA